MPSTQNLAKANVDLMNKRYPYTPPKSVVPSVILPEVTVTAPRLQKPMVTVPNITLENTPDIGPEMVIPKNINISQEP